jgi:hypothetical protein
MGHAHSGAGSDCDCDCDCPCDCDGGALVLWCILVTPMGEICVTRLAETNLPELVLRLILPREPILLDMVLRLDMVLLRQDTLLHILLDVLPISPPIQVLHVNFVVQRCIPPGLRREGNWSNTRILYHCTNRVAAHAIQLEGFRRGTAGMFGAGIYFAPAAAARQKVSGGTRDPSVVITARVWLGFMLHVHPL